MKKTLLFILSLILPALSYDQILPNANSVALPTYQFVDRNGKPLVGAYLCTFAAGTTTPQATYTDNTASTPNPNPLVLDINGRTTFFVGSNLYKMVLYVGGNGACPGTGQVQFSDDGFGNLTGTASSASANFVFQVNNTPAFTASGVGATQRTVASKLSDSVNIRDFGAVCDGVTDDTNAYNLALASSISVTSCGSSKINSAVNIPSTHYLNLTPGTITLGASGKFAFTGDHSTMECSVQNGGTNILVPSGYSVTDGVILMDNRNFETVEGCNISFDQPTNPAVRTDLTAYTAAGISAKSSTRDRLLHICISQAWNAIIMTGNSGGMLMDDLQISAYNIEIDIDGSFDTVRINNNHYWPFGMNAAQQTFFFNSANTGIHTGRCDDLIVSNNLFINGGWGIWAYQGSLGGTFATISDTDFDSYGSINATAGLLLISNSIFTNIAATPCITNNGATVLVSNTEFQLATTGPVQVVLTLGASVTKIDNCRFYLYSVDTSAVYSYGTSIFSIRGCYFYRTPNTAYSYPTINIFSGTRGVVSDNQTSDKGTGSGSFISIAADGFYDVHDNLLVGWTAVFPVGYTIMHQHDNF